MSHANTIRRIRAQLPADVAREFDALVSENQRLRNTLHIVTVWAAIHGADEAMVTDARAALDGTPTEVTT